MSESEHHVFSNWLDKYGKYAQSKQGIHHNIFYEVFRVLLLLTLNNVFAQF